MHIFQGDVKNPQKGTFTQVSGWFSIEIAGFPLPHVIATQQRLAPKKNSDTIRYPATVMWVKQCHPPVIIIFIGGMFTIPSHGWFMTLF